MPVFEYRALTDAGKATKGIIDADTAKDARNKLRLEKVRVTDIQELTRKRKAVKGKAAAGPRKLSLDLHFERGIGPDGEPALVRSGPSAFDDPFAVSDYWQRRRSRDPDLWVVELDIASAERFAAETIIGA